MKKLTFILLAFGIWSNLAAQDTLWYQKTKTFVQRLDSIQEKLSENLLEKTARLTDSLTDAEKDSLELKKLMMLDLLDSFEDQMNYSIFSETEKLKAELELVETEFDKELEQPIEIITKTIIKSIQKNKEDKESSKPKHDKSKSEKKKETKRRKIYMDMAFQYGLNNFFGQTSALTANSAYHVWKSDYFSIDFDLNFPLDKKETFNFYTGFHFLWSYLKPEKPNMYHEIDHNGKLVLTDFGQNLDKTQLRTLFYKVPVGFKIKLSKKWRLGLHAYGKFYRSAKQRLQFKDNYAHYDVKEKRYFNQNKLIWGAGGFIGVKGIQLYFGMDFAPYFTDHDLKLYQIGIRLK